MTTNNLSTPTNTEADESWSSAHAESNYHSKMVVLQTAAQMLNQPQEASDNTKPPS
jgi:hypothetical protein